MKNVALGLALLIACAAAPSAAAAQTILDEWQSVSVPSPPPVRAVTVDPKTTAVLVLDLVKQTCTSRPRCVASIPVVKKLLTTARAAGAPIVYSITATSTTADVLPDLAMASGDPWVQAGADKFLNTQLQSILRSKGVQSVIVVGTAANGAVLDTGTTAALLGLNVIVPVDGMSAEFPYAEQYTTWQFANGPGGVSVKSTITRIDQITFARK